MPFKSDAQRKFMHAKHPEIAKRWEKHTPEGAKLPEHVGQPSDSKMRRAALKAMTNRSK